MSPDADEPLPDPGEEEPEEEDEVSVAAAASGYVYVTVIYPPEIDTVVVTVAAGDAVTVLPAKAVVRQYKPYI